MLSVAFLYCYAESHGVNGRAPMQCFQNTLAYFETVVSYTSKLFITLAAAATLSYTPT
jgi:hypothetical protein